MDNGQDLSQKALEVHRRLLDHYGDPERKTRRPPLDELVLTILSQNTNDTNSGRAWQSLRERFPTWEAVRRAETDEVAKAIQVGGLAHIKAPRIQAILAKLAEERGALDMGFLQHMPPQEARHYLLNLPGVGPKTAACVLLFSLHKPALPVDTHVHRVSSRLGLLPARTGAEKAQDILEKLLPVELYYPFHLNMIRHGRMLCTARAPQCPICPLLDLCDYARSKERTTKSS
ncbi:MAG: endonuclease III [Chloroflexi bacterium]|nr:endonuclease III [Chloroflexota bacterium]